MATFPICDVESKPGTLTLAEFGKPKLLLGASEFMQGNRCVIKL